MLYAICYIYNITPADGADSDVGGNRCDGNNDRKRQVAQNVKNNLSPYQLTRPTQAWVPSWTMS